MVNKNQLLRRLAALACLLLLCAGLAGGQLVQLQLVNGEDYVRQSAYWLTTTSTVSAARGAILDRYGRPMVTNKTEFSLVLVYSAWEQEGQAARLLDLAARVKADAAAAAANTAQNGDGDDTDTENGAAAAAESTAELNDILPISDTAPYAYTTDAATSDGARLSKYIKDSADTLSLTAVQQAIADAKARQEQNPRTDEETGEVIDEVNALDATTLVSAADFLSAMRDYLDRNWGLPETMTDADTRTLVGLYYTMRQNGFDNRTNFTFATGISIDLIAYIKEHHQDYAGVEVESQAVRQYDTEYAAHLLGRAATMWAEEWSGDAYGGPYQGKAGYKMNDITGKTGLELALEPYLHGTAGSSTVQTDLGGQAVNEQASSYAAPQPGDNVVTTIDLDLQAAAEESLAENLAQYGRGGAAVAIDPNSGEVLAMASYPTYSLENYVEEAEARNEDARSPEFNRATLGVYEPGSTFKVLSAIAALEEGIIDANTTITCTGEFEYGGQTFHCNNHSQPMTLDVTQAIKYSCNTFFYTVGRELTGKRLEQWDAKFGLGMLTGIEVDEAAGRAAGPTYREQMVAADPTLQDWLGGDDVQAAIGQSDNGFTPLQLANYIAAVVNGGTLYRPTLVKSVKSYDYSEVVKSETAEVKNTIEMSDTTVDLVMTGMSEVTDEGGTAGSVFADYPIKVGGKTGTAEAIENGIKFDNGLFIAFAPFDDPEIVICVVGEGAEHGSSVTPIVRDMLDTYFQTGDVDTVKSVQQENVIVP